MLGVFNWRKIWAVWRVEEILEPVIFLLRADDILIAATTVIRVIVFL